MQDKENGGDVRSLWNLDPSFTFLNHGSYGATPKVVMEAQHRLRMHVETEPVRYYSREIEGLFDKARAAMSEFLGAESDGLAFVSNATTGVNTVLRSLDFKPGDEILTTNHVYNACNNAAEYVARRSGVKVVTVKIPFPVSSPDIVTEAVLGGITSKTRLILIDHITSPTALVFPVGDIIEAAKAKGIEVLVDGAHAPGMIPLNLRELGATYYTGNCHKWLCAPKGSAVLYVSEEARAKVRPLTISHGANSMRTDRSFFHLEFDWLGTDDYSAALVLPECLEFLRTLYPGGIAEHMKRNHDLAAWAMGQLCSAFNAPPPCPVEMLGSMAAVPFMPLEKQTATTGKAVSPVYERLFREFNIEVPIVRWEPSGQTLVRVSAQAYNKPDDYFYLIDALRKITG